MPEVRKLDFKCNDWDDNKLIFALLNIAIVNGFDHATYISPYREPQPLKLGGNVWIWGYDNDYINGHFCGVTTQTPNAQNTAWFSAENYNVIKSCQLYDH